MKTLYYGTFLMLFPMFSSANQCYLQCLEQVKKKSKNAEQEQVLQELEQCRVKCHKEKAPTLPSSSTEPE